MVEHLRQGKMRTLAITGAAAHGRAIEGRADLEEVGVDVAGSWAGAGSWWKRPHAPADRVLDGVFRQLAQTEEWKADLQANDWANIYVGPPRRAGAWTPRYVELKQILADLGMVKTGRRQEVMDQFPAFVRSGS